MTRVICFILLFCSLYSLACDGKKIHYIEFKKVVGEPRYISVPDINILLPVGVVEEYYHSADGFVFNMGEYGGVSVNYLNLEQHSVDALFAIAQGKNENYCVFKAISERPVINIFSHYVEASYSVIGKFILVQGKTRSNEILNQIYFRNGVGKVISILHYPGENSEKFIQSFITLNIKDDPNNK